MTSAVGYAIDTPPPWRRSACFSGTVGGGAEAATSDVFVPVPEREETASDTGFHSDQISVVVRANPERPTTRQWAARWASGFAPPTDVTFAGRPALERRARQQAHVLDQPLGRPYTRPHQFTPMDAQTRKAPSDRLSLSSSDQPLRSNAVIWIRLPQVSLTLAMTEPVALVGCKVKLAPSGFMRSYSRCTSST